MLKLRKRNLFDSTILVGVCLAGLTTLNIQAAEPVMSRLDNGMEMVLVENHSVPLIACNLVIRVGARDETWETWGAAHFLEHLLFNGTVNRSQEEIYAQFDRLGVYHNAHTGPHFVDFMLLAPADNFSAAFDILTDMIFNSNLPPEKFEKERGIVIEEIARSATMAGEGDILPVALFGNTPPSRSVLGTTESIASLEREAVLDFYHSWYVPNNMLLFVTGDFDSGDMSKLIGKAASTFAPKDAPTRNAIAAPDFDKLQSLGVLHRQGGGEDLEAVTALAAPRPGEPDFVPFMILIDALETRLSNAAPQGWSVETGLIQDPDFSVFHIGLKAPTDSIGHVKPFEFLAGVCAALVNKPPNPAEIARITLNYSADRVFNSERLHYYGIVNAGWWALTSFDDFESWPRRMALINPQQLADAARRRLVQAPKLSLLIEPRPEARSDSNRQAGIPILNQRLPNGATLIVREDRSARVFAVHILVKNRYLWDGEFGAGAVDLLHQWLDRQTHMSGGAFTSKVNELAANIKTADDPNIPYDDYYTSPEFSFIRLEMLPDGWRDGVGLLTQLMAAPIAEGGLLSSARDGAAQCARAKGRSPVSQGSYRLKSRLAPNTPLAAGVYGDVSAITPGNLAKLQQGCFNPNNLIISVSCPTDANEVSREMEKALNALAGFDLEPPHLVEGDETLPVGDTLTMGLPQGAVLTGSIIPGIAAQDVPALIVANAWLSDRMGMVLREERGLAYNLGSGFSIRSFGDAQSGYWEQYVATRRENLSAAHEGILELLNELNGHDFSPAELEQIRNAIIGRMAMRNMPQIGQAYSMGTGLFLHGNPEWDAELLQSLSRVQTADLMRVKSKFLNINNITLQLVN